VKPASGSPATCFGIDADEFLSKSTIEEVDHFLGRDLAGFHDIVDLMSKSHRASFLVLLFSMLAGAQNGSLPDKWVCNWSGSVQRLIEGTGGGVVLAPQFRDAAYRGILNNQTIRIIVRPSRELLAIPKKENR
jgi:hypothetical protein